MDQEPEQSAGTNNFAIKAQGFIYKNYKLLIIVFTTFLLILISLFFYNEFLENKKIKIADQYNSLIIDLEKKNDDKAIIGLKKIINEKDKTYSPLAFYYLLENDLISSKDEINIFFDLIINDLNLNKEIKNLNIYKKGLFNSNYVSEEKLLNILKPILSSESAWKSHAFYLLGEYFFSKGEKQKSKEFFIKIINMEISNLKIKQEAEKRIKRDFSE